MAGHEINDIDVPYSQPVCVTYKSVYVPGGNDETAALRALQRTFEKKGILWDDVKLQTGHLKATVRLAKLAI